MRPVRELEGRGEIVAAVSGGEQREVPPFILHEAGERGLLVQAPFRTQEDIPEVATLEELRIGHHGAITCLDGFVRSKPVGAFSAKGNSLPSYRTVADK